MQSAPGSDPGALSSFDMECGLILDRVVRFLVHVVVDFRRDDLFAVLRNLVIAEAADQARRRIHLQRAVGIGNRDVDMSSTDVGSGIPYGVPSVASYTGGSYSASAAGIRAHVRIRARIRHRAFFIFGNPPSIQMVNGKC